MSEQTKRFYVSNKNESVRMFKSDFMELLSHVHPATPLVLYLPVVAYMLYAAIWQSRLSILAVTGLFLLGVLVWIAAAPVTVGSSGTRRSPTRSFGV